MPDTLCIQCGSRRVHRSRRRNWLEHSVGLLGGQTLRCHECNARFALFGASLVRLGDIGKVVRRVLFLVSVLVALAIVLFGIVWINHMQSALPGPEA